MKRKPISVARRVAFEVLHRVALRDSHAGDLLHTRLVGRAETVKPEDAALAMELTLGVLRWQRRLDHFIDAHARGKKLDAPVRIALRLGAYQLLFLERIPAHAAVNDSVELVKQAGLRSAAGLVNAVLRKLATGGKHKASLPPMPHKASPAERLAIRASHPTWLVERWLARFGEEETTALLAANNGPAPVTLALDPGAPHGFSFACGDDTRMEPGQWIISAGRLRSGRGELPAQFDASLSLGFASYQDEASQMVAFLLDVQPGQQVLDVCSAPGGKALLLARLAGAQGLLIAADLHLHRLRALQQRLVNLGDLAEQSTRHGDAPAKVPARDLRKGSPRAAIHLMAHDATGPLPFAAQFARILVDVPCSGTGTLARNPEIRWRLAPDDLLDLQRRQRAILAHALDVLAPGGRLVYSTCSLEPEENEQVVAAVLREKPGCLLHDGRAALQPHLRPDADVNALFDAQGYFRTFPPRHATDGFFAAVIERM